MIAASIYFTEGFEDPKNNEKIARDLGLPLNNYLSRRAMILEFLEDNEFTEENFRSWVYKKNEEFDKKITINKPYKAQKNINKKKSFVEKTKSFSKEAKAYAKSGFKSASEKDTKNRIDICENCKEFIKTGVFKNRCNICGCFMKVKARWETSHCPLEKW